MCYERRPSAQNNGPRTSSGAALTSAVLYGRIYGRNWVSVAAGDGPGRRRHGVDDIIERLGSARRRPTGVIPTSRRRRAAAAQPAMTSPRPPFFTAPTSRRSQRAKKLINYALICREN